MADPTPRRPHPGGGQPPPARDVGPVPPPDALLPTAAWQADDDLPPGFDNYLPVPIPTPAAPEPDPDDVLPPNPDWVAPSTIPTTPTTNPPRSHAPPTQPRDAARNPPAPSQPVTNHPPAPATQRQAENAQPKAAPPTAAPTDSRPGSSSGPRSNPQPNNQRPATRQTPTARPPAASAAPATPASVPPPTVPPGQQATPAQPNTHVEPTGRLPNATPSTAPGTARPAARRTTVEQPRESIGAQQRFNTVGPVVISQSAASAPAAARPSGLVVVKSDSRPSVHAASLPRVGPQADSAVPAAIRIEDRSQDDEESATTELATAATQNAPPFLISMVVHIGLVLILALIPLGQHITNIVMIEGSYAEQLGEQLLDDSVLTTAIEPFKDVEPAISRDLMPAENPLAAMPQMDIRLEAPGAAVNLEAPSIGMALTGREKGAKTALLAAYGGTATTESSIGMALEWLRKNQQRDGTWSLTGPYADGVTLENRTGATALALLAFQGAGHTHQQGEYRETVSKGLKALLKMQDSDGNFFREGSSGHRLYSQAMASIVVCELYGMTKDPEVKKAAVKALDYAVRFQADDGRGGGGWRYQPGQDVDTSVTGWFVMAFQSGRMAGLESYSQTLDRVSLFLDHVEKIDEDFSGAIQDIGYYYRPDESNLPPRISMTAEALLCRQYLGWKRDDPRLQAGVKKLLLPSNRINWDEPNFYYWYYATQVLHHMGGDEWHRWNTVMREELPAAQVKSGKEKGSWSPAGDSYGYQGGRMYSTCFCVFMLESYYRHLPLYSH